MPGSLDLDKKILIVDDEEYIKKLLSDFFSFNGYETITASNGKEAMDMLMNRSYILLIIGDIPEMDGIELIGKIRNINISLPIIGMSFEDKKSKFLRAGANYFLLKPFIIHHLKSILSSIFSG